MDNGSPSWSELNEQVMELESRVERMKTAGDNLVVDVIEWMRAVNECSASKYRIAEWEKACDD